MSSPLRFRGWDTRKQVMYSSEEMGQDQLTLSVDGRGFINVNGFSTSRSTFPTHIIPMQYVGRKDKNGVEICQDDIVRHDDGIRPPGVFRVYWDSPKMGFSLHDGPSGKFWLRDWCPEFCEIIGNVHEHPELLEEAPLASASGNKSS